MKWGIRRYQNPDGSLTSAGRQRYYKELSKINSRENLRRQGYSLRDKVSSKLNKEIGGDKGKSTEYLRRARDSKQAQLNEKRSESYKKRIASNTPKNWVKKDNLGISAALAGSMAALTSPEARKFTQAATASIGGNLASMLAKSAITTALSSTVVGAVAFTASTMVINNVLNKYGDMDVKDVVKKLRGGNSK